MSDFTELIELLVPGNRNQQHAAACMFFELKWANRMVPNLVYIETKYGISRRILQRARAKLSRLGFIEHVSYLNNRHGGQHGWRLSGRFETALRQMAEKCSLLREKAAGSREKEEMLLHLVAARQPRRGVRKTGEILQHKPHAGGADYVADALETDACRGPDTTGVPPVARSSP